MIHQGDPLRFRCRCCGRLSKSPRPIDADWVIAFALGIVFACVAAIVLKAITGATRC